MLDFTIKMIFYIFERISEFVSLDEEISDVINSKKIVRQKFLSAKVSQKSTWYNLFFNLTFVLWF